LSFQAGLRLLNPARQKSRNRRRRCARCCRQSIQRQCCAPIKRSVQEPNARFRHLGRLRRTLEFNGTRSPGRIPRGVGLSRRPGHSARRRRTQGSGRCLRNRPRAYVQADSGCGRVGPPGDAWSGHRYVAAIAIGGLVAAPGPTRSFAVSSVEPRALLLPRDGASAASPLVPDHGMRDSSRS
jgi:hypothetical protein